MTLPEVTTDFSSAPIPRRHARSIRPHQQIRQSDQKKPHADHDIDLKKGAIDLGKIVRADEPVLVNERA